MNLLSLFSMALGGSLSVEADSSRYILVKVIFRIFWNAFACVTLSDTDESILPHL